MLSIFVKFGGCRVQKANYCLAHVFGVIIALEIQFWRAYRIVPKRVSLKLNEVIVCLFSKDDRKLSKEKGLLYSKISSSAICYSLNASILLFIIGFMQPTLFPKLPAKQFTLLNKYFDYAFDKA